MPPLSLPKKIVFALLPTLLLVVTAEVVVRWRGAADRCPSYKDSILWACDPILYFKINPGQVIEGRPLNRAGFRSPEFEPGRPGVKRLLALGDSCTYGLISPDQFNGLLILSQPYPQELQRLADERIGPGRWEIFNAGVPGYNTYQGLMLLRTKLRGLRPDVLTVRFGWNDLAMSKEQEVGNAFEESDSRLWRAGEDLLLRTALYPFARRLGMELRAWRSAPDAPRVAPDTAEGGWHPNVPLDRFARNLRRIVELGRAEGAEVWLLTSPDPFGTPEDLRLYQSADARSAAQLMLSFNRIPSFARLAEIHAQYNQAVRQVSAETGAVLIDVAAVFRPHPALEFFCAGDVIHTNDAGHRLEAEVLFQELLRRNPQ